MPYIPHEDRAYGQHLTAQLWETEGTSAAGELNYRIAVMINGYLEVYGFDYQRLNDVIGALECNKLETYRRLAAPYEDMKKKLNGDVFSNKIVRATKGKK